MKPKESHSFLLIASGCIMMSEEEGWIMHGSEAVKRVIEHQTVSKQFTEAIRVMKLDPHEHVVQHFKNLTKDPETTAEYPKRPEV
jgi:hypothetical protein